MRRRLGSEWRHRITRRVGRRSVCVVLALAACLTGAAELAHAQGGARPLVAVADGAFQIAGDDTLFMPTDVTVDADGDVYVVDGVNDRIVRFAADGSVRERITAVGEYVLSSPLAAHVDDEGRLWIADTGNTRVLVRAADGGADQIIDLGDGLLSPPPDISDLCVSADGRTLWFVDNDNHRVVRYVHDGMPLQTYGVQGQSLAEFHYPFAIATTENDGVLITDVLNGRVQQLTATGSPAGVIGSYGVELGQFYRPKGVAVGLDGLIWVTDGDLNVMQAFTPEGRLVDVLRDESGAPHRFDYPMGITFDRLGRLYVVELMAHRVVRLAIQRTPEAPPVDVRRRTSFSTPQPRSCTACHFEWMLPLADGQATEIAAVPDNPREHPFVSRSRQCLGCHDGSVDDSRRRVWVDHGHRRGVEPPAGMHVPEDLPLVDGVIECRTCHSAHTSGGEKMADLSTTVFLRIEESPSELCVRCHTDLLGGLPDGAHPLGQMKWDMPAELVDAGAAVERDAAQMTCRSCHTAHGAPFDRLQFLSPQTNDLCLPCHQQMAPAITPDDRPNNHGLEPFGDPEQIAAAHQAFPRLSDDGQAICLSCHSMHHAEPDEHLLASSLDQAQLCFTCHAEMQSIAGSAHDVRELATVSNTLSANATACSGCHAFHRNTLERKVTTLDQTGNCTGCHTAGGHAENLALGGYNHPDAACGECHNPHETRFGDFLKARPAETCRSCHEDQFALTGGPHDITHIADAWPSASRGAKDECLACHRPHADQPADRFRVALAGGGLPQTDAACVGCHTETAPGPGHALAMEHPRDIAGDLTSHHLPLVESLGGQPELGCISCHNPHQRNADASLLRVATNEVGEDLCTDCHQEQAGIHSIGHAAHFLRDAGFQTDSCKPCHLVHADPGSIESGKLWPKSLYAEGKFLDMPTAEAHCVACHHEDGPAVAPGIATHPDVAMFNPIAPTDAGYLPLFNQDGEPDPIGMMTCKTCHLTHGRRESAPLPTNLRAASPRELRARAWHVREYGAQNVCTTCHGLDGLRRFIYFHDPQRRGGPIDGSAIRPTASPGRS